MGGGRLGAADAGMTPGAFSGRHEARAAMLEVLLGALAGEARLLQVWDVEPAQWPWSDAALLEVLARWARPGRRLQLLAPQYDELTRQHPRFVRWRRDYAHCVQARAVEEGFSLQGVPQALLLARLPESCLTLRVFERRLWRGELSHESGEYRRGQEWFDAAAQHAGDSFAPTTLGL